MRKKELTSNQLIEAALGLFVQHGIEKTSLAMIAKEVGITKPSIYYHFDSKEALLDRIFEYTMKDYQFEYFIRIDECNEHNFAEKLYEAGLHMLPENDKDVLKVFKEFISFALRNEKYLEGVAEIEQQFINGFKELLKKGADLGVVSPHNITVKAHMLSLVIDGIQDYMIMQMAFQADYKEVWKEAVNSVLTKNKLEAGMDDDHN